MHVGVVCKNGIVEQKKCVGTQYWFIFYATVVVYILILKVVFTALINHIFFLNLIFFFFQAMCGSTTPP